MDKAASGRRQEAPEVANRGGGLRCESPEQAKAVLRDRGGHDAYFVTRGEDRRRYVDKVWGQHQFAVSLDQSLILALEDEARWTAETSGSGATIPNFLDFIYADGLKAVQPDAVTIVGE